MVRVGLAVAVAMDAFLLRLVAVPALMHLAGSRNWWLPHWLDRALPRLSVEDSGSRPARIAEQPALDPSYRR
jgi:putative drug exporter of the RND superfamily